MGMVALLHHPTSQQSLVFVEHDVTHHPNDSEGMKAGLIRIIPLSANYSCLEPHPERKPSRVGYTGLRAMLQPGTVNRLPPSTSVWNIWPLSETTAADDGRETSPGPVPNPLHVNIRLQPRTLAKCLPTTWMDARCEMRDTSFLQ